MKLFKKQYVLQSRTSLHQLCPAEASWLLVRRSLCTAHHGSCFFMILFGFRRFNCNVARYGSLNFPTFGVYGASWMCRLMHILGEVFKKLGKFRPYFFKCLSAPFSLLPLARRCTYVGTLDGVPLDFDLRLCSYFLILFPFCSKDWIISVDLAESLPILLPAHICR